MREHHSGASSPIANPVSATAPAKPRLQLVSKLPPSDTAHAPLELWHLLSLDAPVVAALWTVFVGWSAGVRLSAADPLAMLLAVWVLYAADRLLDARPLRSGTPNDQLEERHRFHDRHRRLFLPAIVAATIPLALLVHHLAPAVLHLYAVLACLLAGWLLLVHAQPSREPSRFCRLPKELAVGIFFPAAVFIPTVARSPALRLPLLPQALLFAGVCSLNCLMLYAWEHPHIRRQAHASTQWGVLYLVPLSLIIAGIALVLAFLHPSSSLPHPWAIPAAVSTSAALLLLLHHRRARIPAVRLRALADLVLLTPLPLLLFTLARSPR